MKNGGKDVSTVEVIVDVTSGNEVVSGIGCDKSTLMVTFAPISDTFAGMFEIGTSSETDSVTIISSGIEVVGGSTVMVG